MGQTTGHWDWQGGWRLYSYFVAALPAYIDSSIAILVAKSHHGGSALIADWQEVLLEFVDNEIKCN